MKHIFIVNPTAGNGQILEKIEEEVKKRKDTDIEIYKTTGEKDATRYVKRYCEENSEKVRFYACGGDGTANEVANGIVGFPQASMTIYPCGSGNDYVKYYGGKEIFMNIDDLIDGEEVLVDLMRVGDLYSINIINFGFDTCVAKTMINVKNKKVIGGKRAYVTGIVNAILTARYNKCRVWVDGVPLNPVTGKDGKVVNRQKMLLCTVANGQYVGGTFRCAPRSLNNDGMLDVCLVQTIPLFRFLKLLGPYTNGVHLDSEEFAKIIHYIRGKKIHVEAAKGFAFSLDGEIVYSDKFDIEVIPSAIKFCVPKSALKNKPGDLVGAAK